METDAPVTVGAALDDTAALILRPGEPLDQRGPAPDAPAAANVITLLLLADKRSAEARR